MAKFDIEFTTNVAEVCSHIEKALEDLKTDPIGTLERLYHSGTTGRTFVIGPNDRVIVQLRGTIPQSEAAQIKQTLEGYLGRTIAVIGPSVSLTTFRATRDDEIEQIIEKARLSPVSQDAEGELWVRCSDVERAFPPGSVFPDWGPSSGQ